MKSFQYVNAQSVSSAIEVAANKGRFLAGGIDLLGEMKEYISEPGTVINIKELPGLNEIIPGKENWVIGANVTVAEISHHAELRSRFPGLAEAAEEVGSPQIRNVATLGGNLAQHSRCWYYRQRDLSCLKRGGNICYAREGENKYHSIFTGNPCISPAVSNLAVALAALEAKAIVQRGDKILSMSIQELYQKAWENPMAHHSLDAADLVLRVEIPAEQVKQSCYMQISEKSDFDWALVSCAGSAFVQEKRLSNVRLVLGAVAPVPYQGNVPYFIFENREMDEEVAKEAADSLLENATPFAHNGYKVPMAHALVRRVLFRLKELGA